MQGALSDFAILLIFFFLSTHLSYILLELCLQKINELSSYQMIWTDTNGFVLKPEGIEIYDCILPISKVKGLIVLCRARKADDKVLSKV